ncbi:hypothetical protein F8M41_001332 [Gigaspora margarita]|uniref:Uncharacterized protein n=1 Tax=Gigaspora margarita TaxID=4874 RepID=A0A8H3XHN0_GIGMA|nr:hypothetical protein F8M41_001332 [Gigaspora margarita]
MDSRKRSSLWPKGVLLFAMKLDPKQFLLSADQMKWSLIDLERLQNISAIRYFRSVQFFWYPRRVSNRSEKIEQNTAREEFSFKGLGELLGTMTHSSKRLQNSLMV